MVPANTGRSKIKVKKWDIIEINTHKIYTTQFIQKAVVQFTGISQLEVDR